MKYKSLFLSDLHIGSAHAEIEKVVKFLKDNEFENIFLVGDIIDGWMLKHKWRWTSTDNLFFQKILKQGRHNVNIVYIYGNHDDFLKSFDGFDFGNIPIRREYLYESFGKRYLIVHGDQFDGLIRFFPGLQLVGSFIYEASIYVGGLIKKCGIKWSLSLFLKQNTKGALNYISSYKKILVKYAKEKNADGIILGHIHYPEITDFDGVKYMNIGDMVESYTILVEDLNGNFASIKL